MYKTPKGRKALSVIGFVFSAMVAIYWIALFAFDFDCSWVYLTITTLALYRLASVYLQVKRGRPDWKCWFFFAVLVVDFGIMLYLAFLAPVAGNEYFLPAFLAFGAIILFIRAYYEKHHNK